MTRFSLMRTAVAALVLFGGCAVAQHAAATSGPQWGVLDWPATSVRNPSGAALLSVTQAGKRLVAVGERGLVLLSDDAGQHWTQATVPTSVTLTSVAFANASRGWAAGHGAVILQTDDGGKTWGRQFDGRQIWAQAAKTGAEAGMVAKILAEQLPDKPILDLQFIDGQRGYAVGSNGLLLSTDNGGVEWRVHTELLENPKALHLNSVSVRGRNVLIASEQGQMYLSTDAGSSFQLIATPYRGSLFRAEITDKGEILAIGLRGNMVVSTDTGKTWTSIKLETDSPLTAMSVSSSGQVVIGAQSGQLFHYRVGEAQAKPQAARAVPMLSSLLNIDSKTFISAGLRGIALQSLGK